MCTKRLLLTLVALLLPAITIPAGAQGLTKVNVVLNFAAGGGAAGFYHALERGYFRELGLDVSIEPSKGSLPSARNVTPRRAASAHGTLRGFDLQSAKLRPA